MRFSLHFMATCLIAIIFVNLAQAQQKNYEVNAIAFYNVENLFDTIYNPKIYDGDFTPKGSYNYTSEVYQKKLSNLASVISRIASDKESVVNLPGGPAIIGLSEIENKAVIEDLINQPSLKERNYRIVHFESPDARGVDVGMIYRPDLFQVLAAKSLYVNINEGQATKAKTRDVLFVTGLLGGDTVHVMVNHWPSRSGGEAASMWKRERAAQVCKNVVDSLQQINPKSKIIIMGDFNDDPVSPSIAKTLNAKGDIKKVGEVGLYNPWYNFYKKGLGTLGYNDSWNLFDQIIISSGFVGADVMGWKYYKSEIFKREFMVSQFGRFKGYPHRSFSNNAWIDGYSDHFPTVIYLIKESK